VWKRLSITIVLFAMVCIPAAKEPMFGQAGSAKSNSVKHEVYVVPFSHLDRFWAGTGEECLARGNDIISNAIQILKQHPDFRFLVESDNFVENFIASRRGTQESDDFKRLVKEGKIEIAPLWAGTFQEFPPAEVLARNLVYGKLYAREQFGVDERVAHLADLPGFTPQYPQLLREAEVPFMVMTRMGPKDKSLFNWQAPDGSKVMVWNAIYGYCWGAQLDLPDILSAEKREKLEQQIERVQAIAPGPLLMTSGCDLWSPTADLVSNLAALNRDMPATQFTLATPQNFFDRVAKTSGLQTVHGEIPGSWPMVGTSVLNLWQYDIPATNALLTAEKFSTINYALGYADYPQHEFDFLWKRLIESMDHNHDGQGGRLADARKKEYSELAIQRGGEITSDMLRNIAERVQIPVSKGVPIVVFNPAGWTRDDLVETHLTIYGDVVPSHIGEYKSAVRLVDESGRDIPFQILETSENISRALTMIFVARAVPSLGYKSYYLVPAQQPVTFPAASEVTLDQEKDLNNPRRPLGADVIRNDFYRVTVDKATGGVTVFDRALDRDVTKDMVIAAQEERGSHYVGPIYLTGRTLYATVSGTQLEENNPVRTVLTLDEQIDGIPIVQRLTLYKDLKRLDIETRIKWERNRLLNIQQLIPLLQDQPEFHYGVAFGENAASNLIPGSGPALGDEMQKSIWEKYRIIHGWIFGGTRDWGLTVAADHQVVELDPQVIRADMIRGAAYTSVKVERGAEVTSMQYPPPGLYVFRYSMVSGAGDWRANRSFEQGENLNNPLIPVEVVDAVSSKSLPPTRSFGSVQSGNLVISALKKSAKDGSIILRVYEIEGKKAETPISFLGEQQAFRETNLLEENSGTENKHVLQVEPYQIKTLEFRSQN
jgi:alpha-mannosidase